MLCLILTYSGKSGSRLILNIKWGILWWARKKSLFMWGLDIKIRLAASFVTPNGDSWDGFFYSTLTLMIFSSYQGFKKQTSTKKHTGTQTNKCKYKYNVSCSEMQMRIQTIYPAICATAYNTGKNSNGARIFKARKPAINAFPSFLFWTSLFTSWCKNAFLWNDEPTKLNQNLMYWLKCCFFILLKRAEKDMASLHIFLV